MITIDGLVSGLDTASIIEGLVSIQQTQVDRLNSQKATITERQTSFKGIEAQLLALRGAISTLGRSQNNILDSKIATSSNEDLVKVSADSSAVNGTYALTINNLAAAHQIASQGFNSADDQITTGDLTIQVGNGTATTITIDSSNNSVTGLVSEINEQSDDVFASIVTDSSGVRVLLTASESGSTNQIQITNNLAADNGNAVRPDFSGAAVQEAADASVTIGSGAGAITVTSQTNQFEDLFEGLTLNLTGADQNQVVNITVNNNTEASTDAIRDFVTNFNALMDYIDTQTAYNAESDSGGPLQGNRSAIFIQDQIRNRLATSISGISSSANQLSAIGIEFNDRGQLFLNEGRLAEVLDGKDENISNSDIKALFGLAAKGNIAGVEFLFGSSRTQASENPYQVDITQAAEQAVVRGDTLTSNITIDSSNKTLSFSVDGKSTGTLQLTEGVYTQTELADHLETVINSSSELNGQSVSVRIVDGTLSINSNLYGSQSSLSDFSGDALSTLQISSSAEDTGQDVEGHFIVDGQIEQATGTGRLLVGDLENENTADIQLRITLTDDQLVSGAESELTVTRGFASELDRIIGDLIDPVTGQIKSTNESFDDQIESIDKSISSTEALIQSKTESLLEQFAALESTLSSLQNTNSFLVSQLGGFAGTTGFGR